MIIASMEKLNQFWSILELTLILSALRIDVNNNVIVQRDAGLAGHGVDVDGAEVTISTTPVYHSNELFPPSSFSSKIASLHHDTITDQYNSLMRDVLARAPVAQFNQPETSQTSTPTVVSQRPEIITMVVNHPVMTLTPGFRNFSQRIDPLHEEFNLFEAYQPSRMTEDAVRNLRIPSSSSTNSMEEFWESSSNVANVYNESLPNMISDLNISNENDAVLPILNVTAFQSPQNRINTEPTNSNTVDAFLSDFGSDHMNTNGNTVVNLQNAESPRFETTSLRRRELFPMLDSSLVSSDDEEPMCACVQLPHTLDHDYCSTAEDPVARILAKHSYSVKVREKVTTRVIAAPAPRRVRIPSEDEGLGAVANVPVTMTARSGERRITAGSDSGLEDDIEHPSVRTILIDNCRSNILHNVSTPQELLCARH